MEHYIKLSLKRLLDNSQIRQLAD